MTSDSLSISLVGLVQKNGFKISYIGYKYKICKDSKVAGVLCKKLPVSNRKLPVSSTMVRLTLPESLTEKTGNFAEISIKTLVFYHDNSCLFSSVNRS